ncbi:MerR family transcriptional regulator [Actinomycetes bacterium KLBMP 9759]
MRWSTAEVARMSRVSSRTLRHYDHVGLLPPAGTGHGGLRFYERPQLLRLQHILVLRELGLGLDDIRAVIDGSTDEVAALRHHHDRLLAESERLRTLAATVARTIDEREDGPFMAAEKLFEGFRDDRYAAEARELYGERAVESQRRVASWDEGKAGEVKAEMTAVHEALAAAMNAGAAVDDPSVQEIVARHHAWVSHFWTPGREAYIGLGQLYVDDERFTASIDAAAIGLAAYLRDAMAVYANARLT